MIESLEQVELISKILESKRKIENVLHKHKMILNSIKEGNEVKCDIDDILVFSQNISPTLFAPKGWVPGCPFGHPPAPQVEQIRKGLLGNLSSCLVSLEENLPNSSNSNDSEMSQFESAPEILSSSIFEKSGENISNPNSMIQEEEIQILRKVVNNRFQTSTANMNASKKARVIDMNYGFSSDSESGNSDDEDG